MQPTIVVRNALELKNALAAIPDEKLATYQVVIDETDVAIPETVELEFSDSCKVLTILGEHL